MKKFLRRHSPRVSIIIPIFNSSNKLGRCLRSALDQSLEDIEIICVDDGSTDNSMQVISAYKKYDSRIRSIRHESNLGEGASRNTGLKAARGEYVFHLDSDDSVPKNAIENLYSMARLHSSEVAKGGFSIIGKDGDLKAENTESVEIAIYNTNIHENDFLRRIPVSHCSYLYDLKFIRKYAIEYRTDLSVGLDLVWLTEVLTKAKTVSLLECPVYNYHLSANSATQAVYSLRQAQDALEAKRNIFRLLMDASLAESARDVVSSWNYQIKSFWIPISAIDNRSEFFDFFSMFSDVIPEDVVPWNASTPYRYRMLLALLVLERHEDALEYLKILQLTNANNLDDTLRTNYSSHLIESATRDLLRLQVNDLLDRNRWNFSGHNA